MDVHAHQPTLTNEDHRIHIRLNAHDQKISALETSVISLNDSVKDLAVYVKENDKRLFEKLDTLSEKASPKTNWLLVISALGALAAFIVLNIQPMEERGRRNQDWIVDRSEQLVLDYYQFGKNTAKLDNVHYEINEMQSIVHDLLSADAHNAAEVHALSQHLRDIDMGGSRKWVDPTK